MDKDLWDLKELGSKVTEEIAFENSQNESFIHDKKTKRGKKRGRRGKSQEKVKKSCPQRKVQAFSLKRLNLNEYNISCYIGRICTKII